MIDYFLDIPGELPYTIFTGNGIIDKLPELIDLKSYSKLFLVIDERIPEAAWQGLMGVVGGADNVVTLEVSEERKSIDTLTYLWTTFKTANLDRKSLVINLGGGCLLDLSGLACATYMRGIAFVHMPTTLLAQVDAAVGGKVAVNFLQVKNLVGAFCQPRAVVNDVSLLDSLSQREFNSGFAEMIKHGMIFSREHFSRLEDFFSPNSKVELFDLIAESLGIKAEVVKSDVTEASARKLLNFGHTVGHAIESLSHGEGQPLLHGEAVSLGMLVEGRLGVMLNILKQPALDSLRELLKSAGLPIKWSSRTSLEEVLRLMQSDKKNYKGEILATIPTEVGRAVWDQHLEHDAVKAAMEEVLLSE